MLIQYMPAGGGPVTKRGSGIAHHNSPLLSQQSELTPQGRRVAFLHGVGKATVPHSFQPGLWRLRFVAAQRMQSGGPDAQVVRVKVGGDFPASQLVRVGEIGDLV